MTNEEIVKEIKAGNNIKENMSELWNNMVKLIRLIAKEFYGYEEIEDLVQESFFALYDAIEHYDESKGVKFSSYAIYWIKMRMNRYICECSKLIRLPEHEETTRRKYIKFISEYEKEHGKKPTRGQICHFLDIDIEILNKIEKNANLARITSTDKQIETDDGNSTTIIDTIPGSQDENSMIEQVDNNIISVELWKIIEELAEEEKNIIVLRYKQELAIKEIASRMNICEKEVSGLHTKSIRKLRKSIHKIEPLCSDKFVADCYQHVGIESYNRTWNSATERAALRI